MSVQSKSAGRNTGRGKPTIPKLGVTKNRNRRYDRGGKVKHKQG